MLFLDQWKNGEVGGVMPFSVMFGIYGAAIEGGGRKNDVTHVSHDSENYEEILQLAVDIVPHCRPSWS